MWINNHFEYISCPDDFKNIIAEQNGYEAAEYVQNLIDEANYTKNKIETDLTSYESSLDSNTSAFQDILNEIKHIEQQTNQQRTNKTEVLKMIDNIRNIINNQI